MIKAKIKTTHFWGDQLKGINLSLADNVGTLFLPNKRIPPFSGKPEMKEKWLRISRKMVF